MSTSEGRLGHTQSISSCPCTETPPAPALAHTDPHPDFPPSHRTPPTGDARHQQEQGLPLKHIKGAAHDRPHQHRDHQDLRSAGRGEGVAVGVGWSGEQALGEATTCLPSEIGQQTRLPAPRSWLPPSPARAGRPQTNEITALPNRRTAHPIHWMGPTLRLESILAVVGLKKSCIANLSELLTA